MVVDSDADTDSVYEVEYERQSHLITLDEIYKLAKKISEDFDEFSKNPSSKKAESLKWNIITALEQSERLIAAFQKLEEEKQALQDLSSQQNMDNRRLAETLKTLEQFVEEMEESEELMKEELRSLLADCEKQKQENERLKTLISEESAPLVDEQVGSFCSDEENFAKETLSQLKETNRALRQQLALCETELEEEKDKNEELTDFADDIESFAKTLKTKCHKLESEVMQLTSERDNLSIKLDEEGAKLKQLQKINVQVSAKARSTTFGPLRNQTPLCEEFTAEDVYINGSGPDALKGPRTRPDEQFEDVFEVSQSGISQEESSYVKMVQEFEKFSDLQSFCVEKISKPVTSQYHVSNRYSIQEMTTSCEKLTEKLNALDTADITKEFTEFLADERLDESARSNVLTVVTGFIGNSTYSVFEESFPVLATSLMQTYQLGRETNLGMESGLQTQTSVDFSPMSGELNLLDELNKAIASDSLEENEFLLRPHLSTLKEEPSVEIEDMGTDEEGDVPKDEATNLSETPDAKTTEVSEPTTANEETSTSESKIVQLENNSSENGDIRVVNHPYGNYSSYDENHFMSSDDSSSNHVTCASEIADVVKTSSLEGRNFVLEQSSKNESEVSDDILIENSSTDAENSSISGKSPIALFVLSEVQKFDVNSLPENQGENLREESTEKDSSQMDPLSAEVDSKEVVQNSVLRKTNLENNDFSEQFNFDIEISLLENIANNDLNLSAAKISCSGESAENSSVEVQHFTPRSNFETSELPQSGSICENKDVGEYSPIIHQTVSSESSVDFSSRVEISNSVNNPFQNASALDATSNIDATTANLDSYLKTERATVKVTDPFDIATFDVDASLPDNELCSSPNDVSVTAIFDVDDAVCRIDSNKVNEKGAVIITLPCQYSADENIRARNNSSIGLRKIFKRSSKKSKSRQSSVRKTESYELANVSMKSSCLGSTHVQNQSSKSDIMESRKTISENDRFGLDKSIIEQQSEDANGDSANDVQSTKLLIPDDNEMRAARGLRSATMSSVESADTESGSVGVGEVTVSKMKMSRQASRETRYRVNYSKSISHRRKTVMEGLREEKSVDGEMGDIVGKGIVHQTTADIVQESDLRKQKRSDFYKQQDVQVKTDKPIDLSALGEKRQQVMDEKYTEDGFLKIDPKDPNRPRYTKAELLQVIREKADLNLQKMYLEEELELVKEQLKQLQQSHTQTQKRLAQANERRSIRKLFGIFRHRHSHPNANNLAMSSGKASYSASADFSDAKLPAQRRPSCDSVTFDTTGAVSSNGKHSRSVRPPSWVTRTGPKYDNRESSVTLVVPSSPPPPRDTEF